MAAQTGLGSTPGVYQQTGILTTVAAQITSQVNPFPGTLTSNSLVAVMQTSILGPVYQSPGGILNKTDGTYLTTGYVHTGGGP